MNKINTFEEAELLVKDGLGEVISSALLTEEAAGMMSPDDQLINQAKISIFTNEGRSRSNHYVLECRSLVGNTYLLCIGIGDGAAMINYSEDDMLSFREACEDHDISIGHGVPMLAYSYRGIARVSQDLLEA